MKEPTLPRACPEPTVTACGRSDRTHQYTRGGVAGDAPAAWHRNRPEPARASEPSAETVR